MRRLGRFTVTGFFFQDSDPCNGANLFKDMVICRTDPKMETDELQYLAAHPSFRPVTRGELIPEYTAIFRDGEIHPHWVEKEPNHDQS